MYSLLVWPQISNYVKKQRKTVLKEEHGLPFYKEGITDGCSCMSWVMRSLILLQPQSQFMTLNKACDCREARVSLLYL